MNIPTQHTTGDGHNDFILTNGDSDDGSWRLLQNNVKGSPPTRVSQCNVTLSKWSQSPLGPGEPHRKISKCEASVTTERKCVFCKESGSPLMRTDMTRLFLAMMVVILSVAMVHAHMKLWRMEERLAEMESQRSGNNGKFLMFTDKLDGEDLSQNIPSLNFPDKSIETDLMAVGDVKEGSVRKRRDATNRKKKPKKPNDKPKNNKKCNNKNLIDQYCFDKIEGLQPIYNEFEGVFGNKYPFKSFQSAVGECYTDHKVSKLPEVCKDNKINYADAESPLAFYVPVNRSNTTFLNITSEKNGEFTAQESGIFLLQFSIVMIDNHQNHSIGVFVDDTPVMACPPGGYQKPKESLPNHRLCSFNGILHMVNGSKLQLKTMYANTTVRIEKKDKSIVKLTLLHRLSREFKPL